MDEARSSEHTRDFGGRSLFLVFVKFPDGREQALQYLKELREFVPALVYSNESITSGRTFQDRQQLGTNRATPQFPAGTQWALVRRLCLIDDRGLIRATRMIEGIQMRTYSAIPEGDNDFNALRNAQVVAEFQMDREHGFELPCHFARGILSVNTYSNFGTAASKLDSSTLEREMTAALSWKSRQFDWGLMKGLWAR